MGADTKAKTRAGAHLSDVSAAAEGSNLLSTIAPGTPTPLCCRSSSVMLFSRSEASGIPQKSVIAACSSTTVARWLAASPVMLLVPTLRHGRAHGKGMSKGPARDLRCGSRQGIREARRIGVNGR